MHGNQSPLMDDDTYNLQRFVTAQTPVYAEVCEELRAGRNRVHWMWFVFPQIKGLGHSALAVKYALSSREEAHAYAAHPLLAPRVRECARLVPAVEGLSIEQIFGYPDFLKFRSSLTLFAQVASDNQVFLAALQKYFAGVFDELTLARL